jgi:dienelactone hydrolase
MRRLTYSLAGVIAVFFLLSAPQSGQAQAEGKPNAKPSNTLSRVKPDEDWTTPFVSTTHLVPSPPIVAPQGDRATFTRELVSLQWRPFDAIYVYVIKPKGVTKPPPVLFLYGFPSGTKRFLDDSYCRRITEGGCAAIGFESALTGERFRMRPMREWFVSELPESLATSAHDVQYILNYLATRGDLDMNRVGMFGQGSGGSIAILAAAADPRIKAVDLLTPWGDWPDWAEKTAVISKADRPLYQLPKFQNSVAPLDPVAWLPNLADRQVRLQFREDDPAVPDKSREAIEKALPKSATLVTFKTNIAMYAGISGGRLFQWMADKLNAKSVGSAQSTP